MHCKILLYGSAIFMLLMLSTTFVKGADDDDEATAAATVADTSCDGEDCATGTPARTDTAVPSTAKASKMAQTTPKAVVTTRKSRKTTKKTKKNRRIGYIYGSRTGSPFQSINIWLAYDANSETTDKQNDDEKNNDNDEKNNDNDEKNNDSDEKKNDNKEKNIDNKEKKNGNDEKKKNDDKSSEAKHESDEDEDNTEKNSKKKFVKYQCVPFPVRHYPNKGRMPIRNFPPLVSISPWVPIFYDKNTFQTIIFSPKGGFYILPPLVNFYGQRFSVAQLIKWGYASLVSTGTPPSPNVDVAQMVQQQPPDDVDNMARSTGLLFDEKRARFTTNVRTNFAYVKPHYSNVIYQ